MSVLQRQYGLNTTAEDVALVKRNDRAASLALSSSSATPTAEPSSPAPERR